MPGSLGSGSVKYVLLVRELELFDVPLWSTYVFSLPYFIIWVSPIVILTVPAREGNRLDLILIII